MSTPNPDQPAPVPDAGVREKLTEIVFDACDNERNVNEVVDRILALLPAPTPASLPPAMDPEQQRIAIATACGFVAPFTIDRQWEEKGGQDSYDGWWDVLVDSTGKSVPDYLDSLDAMHEAEKVLDVMGGGPKDGNCPRYAYSRELYKLVPEWIQPFRANATQRAEAFLRTLNLWTPTK